MHQKVLSSRVYDIRSIQVYRGQIQKSQLNIKSSFGWNFKKLKAERKPVDMQMFSPPLKHFQLQSEALHTKAFVESLFDLFLRIQSKIEKVPRGIRGEKSSKDMASSRNLVSTIGALASPKIGKKSKICKCHSEISRIFRKNA